ncbi:MAG: DUF4142 domain-containing protein [Leptolyngbya sp. Prado105]|nr:DUF4142 domain-containing protein [Leptolyngbya sp. Prado105]
MMKKYFVLSLCAIVGICFAIGTSLFGSQAVAQAPRVPATPGQQVNLIDVSFANEAAQAGVGNIMLGQLALRRSNNQTVRNFAQAEIQEQQGISADLNRIAPRIGVTLPTTPAARFQAIMSRLSQLSGTQFDTAYLDEGGVNAHLEVAALFQRETAFGRNPELVSVANRSLPTINQHFTIASQATNYRFAQVPRRYNDGQSTSSQ